jgi:hypothetical protein
MADVYVTVKFKTSEFDLVRETIAVQIASLDQRINDHHIPAKDRAALRAELVRLMDLKKSLG